MKQAAIYNRVSTDSQHLENQNLLLTQFVEKQGWQLTGVYQETRSGSDATRPEFCRMMMDAAQSKFQVLVIWSLDRLSREGTLKTLQHLQQLDRWNVGLRSYQEPFLDTAGPFRDVLLAFSATLAKQERLRMSERTKLGLNRARANGAVLGRPKMSQSQVERIIQCATRKNIGARKISALTGLPLSTVSLVLKNYRSDK